MRGGGQAWPQEGSRVAGGPPGVERISDEEEISVPQQVQKQYSVETFKMEFNSSW